MSKLALRAQAVDSADLPLRQDLLTKNASISAKTDFGLGNSPQRGSPTYVAVWRVGDKAKKIIEVTYVGTHEKAEYDRLC